MQHKAMNDIAGQGKTNALIIMEHEQVIYASPLFYQMMEYADDEAAKSDKIGFYDCINEGDKETVKNIIRQAQTNKQQETRYTCKVTTGSGKTITREDHAHFTYDESGTPGRIYIVCREINRQGSEGADPSAETGNTGSPCTILIAEDNRLNMMLIKNLLTLISPQCHIFEAWDGKQALELFKIHTPDIILLDIHMPEKDGYEVAAEIRRFESQTDKKRRPIIAITARTKEGEKQRCLAAGMDEYLPKPVQEKDFKRVINQYMKAFYNSNP